MLWGQLLKNKVLLLKNTFSALFSAGFWDELGMLGEQFPELFPSIHGVSEAVFAGVAPNAAKAYSRWLNQFQEFCAKIARDWTEASAPEAAVFLQTLVNRGMTGTSVAQAAAAITWARQVANHPDPMEWAQKTGTFASS